MWDELLGIDTLSDEEYFALGELCLTDETNFNKVTRLAHLDPKSDFVATNLRFWDFTNSDLRGHNFSRTDLTGAFGVNVITDETTIFAGALVEGSVFAHQVDQARFLDANPHWAKQLRLLRSSEWMSVELWLGDNLLGHEADREHANRVAMLLFNTTSDRSVQKSIMYYGTRLFPSSEAYKGFLIAQLTRDGVSPLASTALRILARVHYDDPVVFQLLRKFVGAADYIVRELAIGGLLNSSRFHEVRAELRAAMVSERSEAIRRSYVRRVAKKLGYVYEYVCLSDRDHGDFKNTITSKAIERIALNWLGGELPPRDDKNPQRAKERAQMIEERSERVRVLFEDMIEAGVPFTIEAEGARAEKRESEVASA